MNMEQHLAARLNHIAPFHVMELMKMAAELETDGRHLIHMGIGEPDFTAPPPVLEAAAKALTDGRLQYTSALGLPALRAAISDHYAQQFGVTVPASRIIVTAGASAALLLACAALVDVGKEVLMPDPCYPCNRHFVVAFEGKPKLIASGPEHRFQLSDDMVREHWGAHTGGVLLASPSNPTGTSIAQSELAKIIASVRERQGFTIVDEIYQGLTYDGKPSTALSLDDDVVVINSFSKYFNMTGWRLGWLVVPERIVPAVEKLAQNLFICPSAIAQHAALACFAPETLAIYEARKAAFQRRRDYIVPALRELGFNIPVTPDGAFYVYADCSHLTKDADAFAKQVLREAGVVIVPGQDFGPATAQSYVRLSYANSLENLQEAVVRLKQFLHDQG
ncbi:pyridoxal phosphate-dependent aminotransferase [Undibacterium oligocarboniphilum]|uniref:Aminotransferase n=2 Tax=Undibacterium oligocarboniphilum TaxID=666702 RepID=A0A850QFW0_9BURK|nr:pyridoxal phosphate-dependent aminotransferase [Undibacterium oligocarboniphilum]MBC3870197.1 pyridoxal phosphate-dependent aminotransferase [Undibacterium oligocarboniphilum]NVO78188.1 pyridoxal phosphate-dependent aminotransferase [Undibacterium oligocarboniphilum]